jgi:hypothetical protein
MYNKLITLYIYKTYQETFIEHIADFFFELETKIVQFFFVNLFFIIKIISFQKLLIFDFIKLHFDVKLKFKKFKKTSKFFFLKLNFKKEANLGIFPFFKNINYKIYRIQRAEIAFAERSLHFVSYYLT